MNINNCTNAINAYKATSYDKEKELKNKPAVVAKEKNTDKAEFSVNKNNIEGLKSSIAKSVDTSASAERIAALKNSIIEGKYNVPAESIALSITEA